MSYSTAEALRTCSPRRDRMPTPLPSRTRRLNGTVITPTITRDAILELTLQQAVASALGRGSTAVRSLINKCPRSHDEATTGAHRPSTLQHAGRSRFGSATAGDLPAPAGTAQPASRCHVRTERGDRLPPERADSACLPWSKGKSGGRWVTRWVT